MNISEILSRKVSYQKNVWSLLEDEFTIREVLNSIKNGVVKKEIGILREYLSSNQIEKYNLHKPRLPAITFSAIFQNQRRLVNLKAYNYLMVIDIDKIGEENIEAVKRLLNNDRYLLAVWKSPSKNGIKGLIFLNYSVQLNQEANIEAHKIAFKQIHKYFFDTYDIEIDSSGNDITRLCFLSYDPDLTLKEEVQPFLCEIDFKDFDKEEVSKRPKKAREERTVPSSFNNPRDRNRPSDRLAISSIIKYLSKKSLSITFTYENWYRVAYAIANTFTYNIGEKYYLKLCRLDGSRHDEEQSKYILRYSYENSKGEITFRTIYYLARELGYKS